MGQKPQILVDTDILIRVFRGNTSHKKILDKEENHLTISYVTFLELLSGLKTKRRVIDFKKQIRAYQLIHISEAISVQAIEIVSTHTTTASIKTADALIAATTLINNLKLYTDNVSDFDFIKGLKLYK
ncbi:MAG: type II toxin-antitoxin system VapC family toxin [Ginsengibacter sp.]